MECIPTLLLWKFMHFWGNFFFFASLLSHLALHTGRLWVWFNVSSATDVSLVCYGLNISLYLGSFGWGQIILHLWRRSTVIYNCIQFSHPSFHPWFLAALSLCPDAPLTFVSPHPLLHPLLLDDRHTFILSERSNPVILHHTQSRLNTGRSQQSHLQSSFEAHWISITDIKQRAVIGDIMISLVFPAFACFWQLLYSFVHLDRVERKTWMCI